MIIFRRRKTILRWIFLFLVLYFLIRFTFKKNNNNQRQTNQLPTDTEVPLIPFPERYCEIPKLLPFTKEIKDAFSPFDHVDCGIDSDWVTVIGGNLTYPSYMNRNHPGFTCYTSKLQREDDWNVTIIDSVVPLQNETVMEAQSMLVECSDSVGRKYKSILATMLPDATRLAQARARLKTPNPGLPRATPASRPPDVILLGLDSMSRQAWKRLMPKTYEYFTEVLGVVTAKGYNVLGEGTPNALFPLLTGFHEKEFHPINKGAEGAEPLDDLSWIWNDFSEAGYLTAYTEDQADINTFNFRCLGFNEVPTDFYGRHHHFVVDGKNFSKRFIKQHQHCIGARHAFQAGFTDLIKEFLRVHTDVPKFAFLLSNMFTHRSNNQASSNVDEALFQFLKDVKADGSLDNMILVLFSDHGDRFSKYRRISTGSLDHHLPMVGFRFPPWFEEKYPEFMANYRENMNNVLVTSYDIHATLKHLLQINKKNFHIHFPQSPTLDRDDKEIQGYSFLEPIPKNRTCAGADIHPFWCSCIPYKYLYPKSTEAIRVGKMFVKVLNEEVLAGYPECISWDLQSVDAFYGADYPEDMNRWKPSTKSNFTALDPYAKDSLLYLRVTMKQTNAKFEFPVHLVNGYYHIDRWYFSRITPIGDHSNCIREKAPSLLHFCNCRVAWWIWTGITNWMYGK